MVKLVTLTMHKKWARQRANADPGPDRTLEVRPHMCQGTDTSFPSQPPQLHGYETWVDEQGCYRARLRVLLPRDARDAGCVESIWAASALELTQKAVQNRVKIWIWETGQ